ncbi:RHS repeat-associated core domain-containing protein, partial [Luteolibacter algae]
GHHHHAKSGLVLTWYRAYDPVTATWLSPDPLGEAGGLNLYGYVGNDPVNYWDPFGLESCDYDDGKGGKDWGKFTKDLFSEIGKQFGNDIQDPAKNRQAIAGAMASGLSGPIAGRLLGGGATTGAATGITRTGFTGYTRHGLNQAISRNGGKGVCPKGIANAITNPKKIINQADGKVKLVGDRATVILNKWGKIITVWGKPRGG